MCVLLLYILVNIYRHVGNGQLQPYFFLGKLEQAFLNQYFMHILSLVSDNNRSWINPKGELW